MVGGQWHSKRHGRVQLAPNTFVACSGRVAGVGQEWVHTPHFQKQTRVHISAFTEAGMGSHLRILKGRHGFTSPHFQRHGFKSLHFQRQTWFTSPHFQRQTWVHISALLEADMGSHLCTFRGRHGFTSPHFQRQTWVHTSSLLEADMGSHLRIFRGRHGFTSPHFERQNMGSHLRTV